ncbi:hypothetical protein PoB_007440200 [Plakobranchus ocellatus]|uniref:Uncharacterized protein n=1 Tax=Plakobranchus ocellatus TaxID=259542 RepID=A0AAV4DUA7_9GAST|nr:hypothetical protein PoB_007440200 [Plakobranchus ocellatus]
MVSITTDYLLLGRPPFSWPAKPLIFLSCFTPPSHAPRGLRGKEAEMKAGDLGVSSPEAGAGLEGDWGLEGERGHSTGEAEAVGEWGWKNPPELRISHPQLPWPETQND